MTATRHPIWDIADQIQMDIRAASTKLVQLRSYLAGLELGDPQPTVFMNGPVTADACDTCGVGGDTHAADCSVVARAHVPSRGGS